MCSANIGAEMTAAIILFSACSISKSRAMGIARKDDQRIHRRMDDVHDLRGHLFKGSSACGSMVRPIVSCISFLRAGSGGLFILTQPGCALVPWPYTSLSRRVVKRGQRTYRLHWPPRRRC